MIRFHYILTNSVVISFGTNMTLLMCKQKEKEIQNFLLLKKLHTYSNKRQLLFPQIVHFSAIGSIFSAVSTIIGVKPRRIARIFQSP